MKYKPLTDEELNSQRGLLKPGEVDFEVIKAREKLSKAGNHMIELMAKVWDKDGKTANIFDYLLDSQAWKIKHFWESVGLSENYPKGDMEVEALIGLGGKCVIVTQKDETGKYGDQTKIKDYLKKDGKEIKKEDDVPF